MKLTAKLTTIVLIVPGAIKVTNMLITAMIILQFEPIHKSSCIRQKLRIPLTAHSMLKNVDLWLQSCT